MERADRRYKFEHNWAKGHSYFTFGEYYNPRKMGQGRIKAVNEYELNPQEEFGKNILHKNFDIITLVMNGNLRHNSTVKERVLLEKGQCHLLRIASQEIKHGLQNTDQNAKGEIFEFWVENSNIFSNDEGEQTIYPFDAIRKQLNELQTIIKNENFEFSICHLDKGKTVTVLNESEKNVFILNLNGPTLLNETTQLNDRDAVTNVAASYSFKSTEKCITLLVLKTL